MDKNLPFAVIYDGDHFTDGFRVADEYDAINAAIDVLVTWMDAQRAEWNPVTGPTDAQRDAWNYMIGTCTVFVYRVIPGKDEPDEEDVVWDMEDDVLREIGWEDI